MFLFKLELLSETEMQKKHLPSPELAGADPLSGAPTTVKLVRSPVTCQDR